MMSPVMRRSRAWQFIPFAVVGVLYFICMSIWDLNQKVAKASVAEKTIWGLSTKLQNIKKELEEDNGKANIKIAKLHEMVKILRSENKKMKEDLDRRKDADEMYAVERKEIDSKLTNFKQSASENINPHSYRASAVRYTLKSVWDAYTPHMGADEIQPVSNASKLWDTDNKQMVTLVDSLDTLYLAGLHTEFQEGIEYIAKNFDFTPSSSVSLFETTIRVLGGLLSAFALSNDDRVLAAAVQVGNKLVGAYSEEAISSNGGMPYPSWNPSTSTGHSNYGTFLAESGSVQLEYYYLYHATGDEKFLEPLKLMPKFKSQTYPSGLIGSSWNGGSFSGRISTGSYSDSYYEYLLKLWLLTEQNEELYKDMYIAAADGIVDHLILDIKLTNGTQAFVSSGDNYSQQFNVFENDNFEHLSCFVPGMLALGSVYLPPLQAEKHLKAAKKVASFCAHMYLDTETGLSPDEVSIGVNKEKSLVKRNYGLRPETVESLFYLWRVTRDPIYREWGWSIYLSIERHCRVCQKCKASGYSEVSDVTIVPPYLTDHMDTFFTGETLKYLYLLFADDDALDLDCWVLNTEAHPFPKFIPYHVTPVNHIPEKCKKA
eukprot:TRINITY_DN5697_c0_g1_i1.p1 TRINITY_DN5697_c0_g1~~TRINITY_DN5697_c0_g1_i1.p1  ORF type:complete len:601 (+),score=75.46 TRINITY_DN5697_c0_g1_i1:149-1951(+)